MFYFLKLSLTGANQAEILQKLKNGGDEAIQTADGLCVKSSKSPAEISRLTGVEAEPLDTREDLAPDVAAFVGGIK